MQWRSRKRCMRSICCKLDLHVWHPRNPATARTEVTIAFQLPNARANEWSKLLGTLLVLSSNSALTVFMID